MNPMPYIDGEHFVFPDGRRLARVRGAEGEPGNPAALAEPTGDGGQSAEPQAPAGADPRVLEQMQQQMEQFGGVVGQMAEYMPAIQQIAQQQQGQQEPEPSLEEMAAAFFGDPGYGQGEPQYDPYTGEPLQQQAPPQQQQQQADPSQMIDLFRRVVREEVAPLQGELTARQQREQQEAWNNLYQEFPQMQDPTTAPRIAESVARAAQLFGRDQAEAERLASNPGFVRMAYLSSVNEAQARGETPAGAGDGIHPIEAGGGASAPGDATVDEGDAIVSAGGGGSGSYFG